MKKVTFILLGINLLMFIYISFFDGSVTLSMSETGIKERDVYLNIVTTDRCSYNMVKKIVGDKHNVKYLFKDKEEMINYKITQEAMSNISNMDLFIYLGADNEPWISQFINGVEKGKVGIIDLSRGIRILAYENVKKEGDYSINQNPNYLMSPEEYKVALYNIKTAIQEKDVENREFYEENFDKVRKELDSQMTDIKTAMSKGEKANFYTLDEEGTYLYNYLGIKVEKVTLDDLEEGTKFEEDKNNILLHFENGQTLGEYDVITNKKLRIVDLKEPTGKESTCNLMIDNSKIISNSIKPIEENNNDDK